MGEKVSVQVTDPKVIALTLQMYGVAIAFEALAGDTPKSVLPGFVLAMALIEKELADMRAQTSGAVYRQVAKAGYDIAKVAGISTSIKNFVPHIEVEFADLSDLAEDKSA